MGGGVCANPGQSPFSSMLIIIDNRIVIQVLFESEEPHFYTGDISDSAALLVRHDYDDYDYHDYHDDYDSKDGHCNGFDSQEWVGEFVTLGSGDGSGWAFDQSGSGSGDLPWDE